MPSPIGYGFEAITTQKLLLGISLSDDLGVRIRNTTMTNLTHNQRIVFAYASGLHRIMGCSEGETPPPVLESQVNISEMLDGSAAGPRPTFALVASKPRFLLYCEIAPVKTP